MTTVFVYGTLKRGLELSQLLAGETFVGTAQTTDHFRMVSLHGGDYPGLYASPENGRSIEGELWSVSPACLAELDRVEATDQGLYSRSAISLLPPHDTLAAQAYYYLGNITGLPDAGSRW